MVLSSLALASVRLFAPGMKATDSTMSLWPVSGWPITVGCAGTVTSHSRMVWSALATASVRPSGLKAIELIVPLAPAAAGR